MELLVIGIVCLAIAAGSAVFGVVQLCERGKPFNNSYIFASEQERETMNLKPLFKQSGIVFLLIGVIFLINAAGCLMKNSAIFYLLIPVIAGTLVFAIISSIVISKKK